MKKLSRLPLPRFCGDCTRFLGSRQKVGEGHCVFGCRNERFLNISPRPYWCQTGSSRSAAILRNKEVR